MLVLVLVLVSVDRVGLRKDKTEMNDPLFLCLFLRAPHGFMSV